MTRTSEQDECAPIATLKGKANALKRHRGPDDPATIEARLRLRSAVLEQHIREVVDAAPPLTAEQRIRLAGLLAPTGGGPVAA